MEAGLFVRHLRYFSNIENICINEQIVNLLREAALYIGELLENAEHMKMPNQDVVKLIFDFDEHQFSLRRYLECRTCCVSIVCCACFFFLSLSLACQQTFNERQIVFSGEFFVNHFCFSVWDQIQDLIALSVEEFEAHKQLKHTVQCGTNSLFSPQVGPDAESTICQNKMATTSVSWLRNSKHIH